MATLKSVLLISLSTIVLMISFGSERGETAASCSQPLAGSTCYRTVMQVGYQTVYSRSGREAYYACGVWNWGRCSKTIYSQTSSRVSVMIYRTETYCCNGYIHIGGSCKSECSPTCEAGYTCVAPNTCRRGVQLMLGGVNYPNNSVIQFDSIYYTLDHCHSLLCMTDRVPCCSHPQTGSWYNVQPNGSFTGVSQSVNSGYYQSRENDGTIRLQQAEAVQSTNSSLYYCCQLLDATSTTQTLCVTITLYSPGVWLSLDGQLVPNNSAVELREVYETSDDIDSSVHTLTCVTPKRPCCKTSPDRFGEWFYPNRSAVSIDESGNSFYADRGDDGTVHLHRRGITALSAAMGQYCCEIPNTNDVNNTLCIHFIDSSPGAWLMASKDGHVYPNNTIISLSEVFGTRNSLLCVTERRPCCSGSNRAGDWHYQNGTVVPSYGQTFAFYTSGGDDGAVRLHARDSMISLMNASQFCCEILNINDLSQKLCINICDSDCEIMSELVTETTTLVTQKQVTTEVLSTRQTSSNSRVTIIGSVAAACAVLFCTLIVTTAIALWKYCSLKARITQNLTKLNTQSIQHIKHSDATLKKTEDLDDDYIIVNDNGNNVHIYEIVPD